MALFFRAGSTRRWTLAGALVLATGALLVATGGPAAAVVVSSYQWTATAGAATGATPDGIGTSDVVCPAVGWCVGVGYDLANSGGNIQMLSSGQWTSQNPQSDGIDLSSVACPSVGSCVAVGSLVDGGGAVIDTLSSGSWSGISAPTTGLDPSPGATPEVNLSQVSCPTDTFCTAVGTYDSASGDEGLIETLQGGTWQATTAPLSGLAPPAGSTGPGGNAIHLTGVSCPASGSCFAVGSYYDSSGVSDFGLIETLNGGTWRASTAPSTGLNPAAGTNPTSIGLGQIDCTSVTSCLAIGTYDDASSNVDGLFESLSGGTWTAATAPLAGLNPAAITSNLNVSLFSLDCVSSSWCVVVGSYTDTTGTQDGLIETLNGANWTASTAPLVSLTGNGPAVGSFALTDVSCDAVGSCVAIGGNNLIETLFDGEWLPSTAPAVNDPTGSGVVLGAVACPAAGSCISLGAQNVGRSANGLIETQSVGPTPIAGYWEVASDGGLFSYAAPFNGSMGGSPLNAPIVGMAKDPCTGGYWEVASDGGIFSFNAPFYGSMGGKPLNAPIVGIAAYASTTTCGYWEVASDGGIFSFHAPYHGSMGGQPLVKPIVGISTDRLTGGYLEVASDGGIFAFNAPFYGSMGGHPLAQPVVGIASDPSTGGYWEVASDGGIFSFNAPFSGSMGGQHLVKPIVGMATDVFTGGYWEVASDGGIFAFNAPFWGSMGGQPLVKPVVGIASNP